MPATSRAQYRFMQAVAHGMAPRRGHGPTPSQAKEYVAGQSPKGLPARAKTKKKPRR
jgi:hypothetical protein